MQFKETDAEMNAKIMNNKSREYMIFNVFLRMNSTEVKAGTEIKKKYLSLAVCMSLSLSLSAELAVSFASLSFE